MESIGKMLKNKIGDEVNKQIGLSGQDRPAEFLVAGSDLVKDINEKEEKLKGGESDKLTLMNIAQKHAYDDSTDSVSKSKINKMYLHLKRQLNKGIKIEMEHTKSKKVATEIAKDHLSENPNYYTELKKIETKEQMIKRSIKSGSSDKLVSKTKMKTPIGKLVSLGKSESKEATSASAAGQFSGPAFSLFSQDKSKVDGEKPKSKKEETKEATGASSSGQYSTPQIWAKSMGKKNWKPSRKTQIPGGKFVTVKEKCKKFPYCNQGDIKSLNIFENETLKNVIKNIEEKHGISENIIKAVIQYEIEKLNMKK